MVLSGAGRPPDFRLFVCRAQLVKVEGVHLLGNVREEKGQKRLDQDSGDVAEVKVEPDTVATLPQRHFPQGTERP